MTFIMVLLLGAGTLFISSSLDCTPIASTFQKIASGQQVDWSGNNCQSQPITFNLFGTVGGSQYTKTNKLANGFDCGQCNAWNMALCAGNAFWISKDFCNQCSECSAAKITQG